MNYRDGKRNTVKLATMAVVTMGMLVAITANGYGVPATSPDAVKLMGMALHDADNSQGIDGSVSVEVGRNQQYLMKSDVNNPLTQADIGKTALLTSDHTIVTSGDNLLAVGDILGIEPDGYAWVEIGYGHASGRVLPVLASELLFSSLSNANYANNLFSANDSNLSAKGIINSTGFNLDFSTPSESFQGAVGNSVFGSNPSEFTGVYFAMGKNRGASDYSISLMLIDSGVEVQRIIAYNNLMPKTSDRFNVKLVGHDVVFTNLQTSEVWLITTPNIDVSSVQLSSTTPIYLYGN